MNPVKCFRRLADLVQPHSIYLYSNKLQFPQCGKDSIIIQKKRLPQSASTSHTIMGRKNFSLILTNFNKKKPPADLGIGRGIYHQLGLRGERQIQYETQILIPFLFCFEYFSVFSLMQSPEVVIFFLCQLLIIF